MDERQKHEMILENKHPSGADEWFCPTCGRRMLISWEPKFRRTVLEAGDPQAIHGGFRIDLPMGDLPASAAMGSPSHEYQENVELNIDDARLGPWKAWLEKRGFEDFWDRDIQ
jgi:hypothetical protein